MKPQLLCRLFRLLTSGGPSTSLGVTGTATSLSVTGTATSLGVTGTATSLGVTDTATSLGVTGPMPTPGPPSSPRPFASSPFLPLALSPLRPFAFSSLLPLALSPFRLFAPSSPRPLAPSSFRLFAPSSPRPLVPSPLLPLVLSFLLSFPLSAQTLPQGYRLEYKQNFSNPAALTDFWYNRTPGWKLSPIQGNQTLYGETGTPADTLPVPMNRAILKNRIFGDFILEADIRIQENGHPTILLDVKDSDRYYYILFAADNTQGIFLVKNGKDIPLPLQISNPAPLKPGVWNKVRVERNIVKRTIRVYVGNMAIPVMEAKDYELVMGYIGFGIADGAGWFDNVGVWAPTVLPDTE